MMADDVQQKIAEALDAGHPMSAIAEHLASHENPDYQAYGKSWIESKNAFPTRKTDFQEEKKNLAGTITPFLNLVNEYPQETLGLIGGAVLGTAAYKVKNALEDRKIKRETHASEMEKNKAYVRQVELQGKNVAGTPELTTKELAQSVKQAESTVSKTKSDFLNDYSEQKYGAPLAKLEEISGGKIKSLADVDVVGGTFAKGGNITVNPTGAFTPKADYTKTPVIPTDGPFFNPSSAAPQANAPTTTFNPLADRPNPYITPSVQAGVEAGNPAQAVQTVIAQELDKTAIAETSGAMKPNYNKTKKSPIGPGAYNWLAGQEGPKAPEVWRNLVGEKNMPYNEFMEKVKPVYEGYIGSYGEPDPFKQVAKPGEYKRPSMVPENIRGSSNLKGLAGLAGTAGLLMAGTTPESKAAMARASEAIKDIGIAPEAILRGKGDELGRMGNAYVTAGNPNYLRELQYQIGIEKDPQRKDILLREFQKIGGSGAGRGIAPPSAYMR